MKTIIRRTISETLIKQSGLYPVIGITGPRQSGKTTLVRTCFPEKRYVSLEDYDTREFAVSDPRGFLDRMPEGGIIDEIQRVPALLSYIQTIVDEPSQRKRFVLTGSNQFLLLKHVSQSLAGRISLLRLLPFTVTELGVTESGRLPLNHFLYNGGYPRIYRESLNPTDWYANYVETYLEKDLKDIVNVLNLDLFTMFLSVIASCCGQLLNLSSIGSVLGIDQKTVKAWIAALQQSQIVILLQPYFKNYRKRVVKTPKLYFYDTGLACALLKIKSPDALADHFARGQLFENFVVSELHKESFHHNLRTDFYFWRDHTGHEVDCLFEDNGAVVPVEIKSSQTVRDDFFNGLRYFTGIEKKAGKRSYVVYGGDESQVRFQAIKVLPWKEVAHVLI
jgi:predicted AAA+ superfamily ATPase